MKPREFVEKYWFDSFPNKPSKSVTQILFWIVDNKLTNEGKKQYKKLVKNLDV